MNKNLSIFNTIRNSISNSMQDSIYQCALYVNAMAGVHRGYNTENIPQFTGEYKKGIICNVSICGSDANPVDEYCKI